MGKSRQELEAQYKQLRDVKMNAFFGQTYQADEFAKALIDRTNIATVCFDNLAKES